MANLSYGSTGEEVKKVQTALGFTGADVDGIYGTKTQNAVINYQKENGLTADGIVGPKTNAVLFTGDQKATDTTAKQTVANTGSNTNTGTNTNKNPTAPTVGKYTPTTAPEAGVYTPTTAPEAGVYTPTTAPEAGQFTYEDYTKPTFTLSDNYNTANGILEQHRANSIGPYTPVYEDKADSWLSKYENRDPFSYDYNSDALYQQYKDQYIQQGQLAMMDTIGQASAMTGGYGNSYAQSVGQQAYNQYLNQLNDVGLELYDRAYNRYNQEGQDMLNMYGLYMDREQYERTKYQQDVENWYREDSRLQGIADNYYNREWNEYTYNTNMDWNQYTMGRSEAREDFNRSENQKWDTYLIGEEQNWDMYNRAEDQKWDTYLMGEEQNWDMYNRTEDQKWDSYLMGVEETNTAKSDLKSLIVGYGHNPTDEELKAAGMTREEADSYLKTYNSNVTTKTGSSSGTQTDATSGPLTFKNTNDLQFWTSQITKAKESDDPVAGLNQIGKDLESMGYTQDQVADYLYDHYMELIEKGIIDPEDLGIDVSSGGSSSGGNGGGTSYWYAK